MSWEYVGLNIYSEFKEKERLVGGFYINYSMNWKFSAGDFYSNL